MEKQGGIYQIRNTINNKIYIGSAININKRWGEHISLLKNGTHHSILLQRSWNKHGENKFIFEIIEIVEELKQLIIREQYYKDLYKSYDPKLGYDICPTAGSALGVKHSKETKEKKLGKNNPMFGKTGELHPRFGKHHSMITKRRISKSFASLTDEQIVEIRKLYKETKTSHRKLSKQFPSSYRTIGRIIKKDYIFKEGVPSDSASM